MAACWAWLVLSLYSRISTDASLASRLTDEQFHCRRLGNPIGMRQTL
jgi:hypothetical protein